MNNAFARNSSHLNGLRTAQNYIDECVLSDTQEGSEVLFHYMRTLDYDGLRGFAETIHNWMRVEQSREDTHVD